jgi:DNA/RNA endonuclease YhcR with UshA esterase domain
MGPVRVGLLVVLWVVTTEAWGQMSIGSLLSSADSSNLELVTLQGVAHLSRVRQNALGGKCGSTAFTLQDDTGSIDVAIRRSNRLIEPLREGDRVQVTAQMKVFRDRENIPLLICVEATAIQHLGQ